MDIPVAFFTFNRLDTTKIVFEEIRRAGPKRLYLVSDGARPGREGEAAAIKDVRTYIEGNIDWDCEVYKDYAGSNMGCKKRMASGITWVFEHEEMAVILEDDCRPTQDFFPYMEELLERYKDDDRVGMVSGFKRVSGYPMDASYTFSRFPEIWGWGTWKRAWDRYDIDIKNWPELKKKRYFKRFYNLFGYLKEKRHFDSVYTHVCDTWDYQWAYTVLENGWSSIVPHVNMIENLGFGRADATHTTGEAGQDFRCCPMGFPLRHPDKVMIDEDYDDVYKRHVWGIQAMCMAVIRKIKG